MQFNSSKTKGLLACFVCIAIIKHIGAVRIQTTFTPSTDVTVSVPCGDEKVVAIDSVTASSGDECRKAAFIFAAETLLGQPGSEAAHGITACGAGVTVTIDYHCVDSSQVVNICDVKNMNSDSADTFYVHSPNFPAYYGNGRECNAQFHAGQAVNLKIPFLDIEPRAGVGCYDHLYITSGSDEFRESDLCGDFQYDVMPVSSSISTLGLELKTDSSNWDDTAGPHSGFLARVMLEENYCDPNPCSGGQVCMNDRENNMHVCKASYCDPNPCAEYGGACMADPDNMDALCIVGEMETTTTTTTSTTTTTTTTTPTTTTTTQGNPPTSGCDGVVCQNGGSCNEDTGACDCIEGYQGELCEIITVGPADNCAGVVCQNGGECLDDGDGYNCACATGYTGEHCEMQVNPLDDCVGVVCQNGGACQDDFSAYYCKCATGYMGMHCEIPDPTPAALSSSPCTIPCSVFNIALTSVVIFISLYI